MIAVSPRTRTGMNKFARWLMLAGAAGLAVPISASWPPKIELIELLVFNGTNAVFIHFDTEANYY